ncbi:MAG: TadE/TadG family type IV pilus assembly protein [Pseudomonadota bacterium]
MGETGRSVERGNATRSFRGLLRAFSRAQDGVAALEFGLLALPFLMILMATIELSILMATNSTVSSALGAASRQIRTGQVQAGDLDRDDILNTVCDFLNNVGGCDGKLYLEVRNFSQFSAYNSNEPICSDRGGEPPFEPGAAGDVVMVRICYIYDVLIPGVGITLATIGDDKRAIVSTSVFRNEPFGDILQ